MSLHSALPAVTNPAATSDAGSLLRSSSTDVDEHCASLGPWRLNYDQISPGAFHGSFTQLSLPRLDVFREVTSQQVRQYGRLGSHSFGIGLPWLARGDVNFNGSCVAGNKVIACFDADVDMCTPRAFEFRGVIMNIALIEEIMASLRIDLPRGIWHTLQAIEMAQGPVDRLRRLLTAIHDTIEREPSKFDHPAICRGIEDSLLIEIADMLPTARASDDVRGGAARKRIVDRACEMMLSQLDDAPMSMLEVCKEVGASRRKLNYCFQEVLGASPVSYLRAVRLNSVRRELKRWQGDRPPGIYDIAVRYGFWHFSQFSLDYKRHFAELPSQTLRRATSTHRSAGAAP